MTRYIFTSPVKDAQQWASHCDEFIRLFSPFASELAFYVAADGSNTTALMINIHDMEGLMAFSQTSDHAALRQAVGALDGGERFIEHEPEG